MKINDKGSREDVAGPDMGFETISLQLNHHTSAASGGRQYGALAATHNAFAQVICEQVD